jgi:hypothetical protein
MSPKVDSVSLLRLRSNSSFSIAHSDLGCAASGSTMPFLQTINTASHINQDIFARAPQQHENLLLLMDLKHRIKSKKNKLQMLCLNIFK